MSETIQADSASTTKRRRPRQGVVLASVGAFLVIALIATALFLTNMIQNGGVRKIVVVNDATVVFMQPIKATTPERDQRCAVQYGGTLYRVSDMPKGYDADWNIVNQDRADQVTAYLATYTAPAAPEPSSPLKDVKNCTTGTKVSVNVALYKLFPSGEK